MEHRIFSLSFIIEGTTEKLLQFKMPMEAICYKNFCFKDQNVIFNTIEKVKTMNNLYNYNIFLNCGSVYLFSAAPYKFICTYHEDVLFHSMTIEIVGQRQKLLTHIPKIEGSQPPIE